MSDGKVKTKRRTRIATKYKQLDKKFKALTIFGILFLCIGVPSIILGSIWAYNTFTIGGEKAEPTLVYSYVFVYDWGSGELLDDLCPVTIQVNDQPITDINDAYDTANYKSLVSAKYPEDIEVDLSSYDYAIFTINPDEDTDGYWALDNVVYELNGNANFVFYAKHESTDIYGNVLETGSGTAWDGSDSNNCSAYVWFPYVTELERHFGTKWNIDDDLEDLSANTLERLNNENKWRCTPILFDLSVDQADHERTGDYLLITETTALKFDFNDTIGASTSVTGLNITVDSDVDYLVEYGAGSDNDKLFIVVTETWGCTNGAFNLNFEITLGANITCDNVYIGTLSIPGRYFNDVAPTFASLQTLV